jgi:hypothetical protein
LREATRTLALVGVLESRVGDGTYVTTLEPELLLAGVGFVSDLVSVGSLLEIHQIRRLLEPEADATRKPVPKRESGPTSYSMPATEVRVSRCFSKAL